MKRNEVWFRNFIQVGDQKEVEFDSLPLEKRREYSEKLQENFMAGASARFRRVTKDETA